MSDTPRAARTAPHRAPMFRALLHGAPLHRTAPLRALQLRAPMLRAVLVAATIVAAGVGAAFAHLPPKPLPPPPDTALVVIDVQNFYFEGGRLPLVGSVEAARKARVLLDLFRAKGWPVIHVRHVPTEKLGADGQPADPQYAFRPEVAPRPGEKIVTKHQVNSFRDTDLLPFLRALGVKKLVLAGMQTHMCLEAATRAAADFGFEVTVVHDACATRALSFGGREVPAEQVHAAVLAALSGAYAKVVGLDEFVAAVGSGGSTTR